MAPPNLIISLFDGHVTLTVVDTETFDYVDDIFVEEHDLNFSVSETSGVDENSVYVLHFLGMRDPKLLQNIIDGIDQNELQRIWNLNN